MVPVSSEKLSAVGYDPNTQTLVTEMRGGARYQCDGVPPELFDSLMAAQSKGKFYHQTFFRQYNEHRI